MQGCETTYLGVEGGDLAEVVVVGGVMAVHITRGLEDEINSMKA